MAEKGKFKPLTNALGVPGTSYKMQLGLIDEKWASRLIKGNKILAEKSYELLEDEQYPNTNFLVGFVLQNAAIPNINPRQVMKVTESLLSRAKENYDKLEISAIEAKVKEPVSTKSPVKAQELSEQEKRKKFQEKVKASKQESSMGTKAKRKLPSIPSAQTPVKTPNLTPKQTKVPEPSPGEERHGGHKFCPYCGKDLDWKYCPYCGKKLP
ncbi:MAG: zinc ribbon domain-containing protein [Promethearchaeota archaeon]|nr:MAG: zinc ribbon domain-containing protein [Candidatus Lokiarchaeota archaeon]